MRRDKCLAKWPILDAQVIAINCESFDKLWNGHSGHSLPRYQIDIRPGSWVNWKDASNSIFTLAFSLSLLRFYGLCFVVPTLCRRISLFISHFWDSALWPLVMTNQREIIFAGWANKLQLLVGEIFVESTRPFPDYNC